MITFLIYAPTIGLLFYPIFLIASLMGLGVKEEQWWKKLFFWATILYPLVYVGLMVLFSSSGEIFYLIAFYLYLSMLILATIVVE